MSLTHSKISEKFFFFFLFMGWTIKLSLEVTGTRIDCSERDLKHFNE